MKSSRHLLRSLLVGSLFAGVALGASATAAVVQAGTEPVVEGLGAGGEYHPLTPARIFDSRPGLAINDVAPLGPKPMKPAAEGGGTFDIQLLGVGVIPAYSADVLAVVANITVTEPTTQGYLNAYGSGAVDGGAAIINFSKSQTVPNLAIVRPGAEGKLTVKLVGTAGVAATAHVVIDVFGWFSTSASEDFGARLVPVTPGRILDTRGAVNRTPAGAPLAQQETIRVPVRGVDAVDPAVTDIVPDSADIVGVVLNMAGVNDLATSTPTHLSVVPSDLPAGTVPSTANLNLVRGQVKSNMVVVPVDPVDGSIRVFNNQGTTHVVLDVVGYLIANRDPATRQGRVVPLSAPFRGFDTREAAFGSVALPPGTAEDWSFADFVASVNIGGAPVGSQMGVIGNLTSASLSRQYPTQPVGSFLTAYPSDATRPTSANLNMIEGPPTQNMVIMKYSATTTARVYNLAGYVHYVYDASAVVLTD